LRCSAGSRSDNPCWREATAWSGPEGCRYAVCEEHRRVEELATESCHLQVAEGVCEEWLRMAEA